MRRLFSFPIRHVDSGTRLNVLLQERCFVAAARNVACGVEEDELRTRNQRCILQDVAGALSLLLSELTVVTVGIVHDVLGNEILQRLAILAACQVINAE